MSDKVPGAVLTPSQRAFLRGEKKVKQPARTRHAIRERVQRAFADLAILFCYLEHKDIYQIFYNKEPNDYYHPLGYGQSEKFPELVWEAIKIEETNTVIGAGGMRQTHAFMYLALFRGLSHEFGIPIKALVSELVKRGLQDMYGKMGQVAEVDVTVDIDFPDVDPHEMHERFENGKGLTDKELEWLAHLRTIDYTLFEKFIQEQD